MIPLLLSMLAACGPPTDNDAGAATSAKLDVPEAPAVRVEVATLKPTQAQMKLSLPGEVEGKRDAGLAAALGGYVESVLIEPGDNVRSGQSLVRVDTAMYAAQRDQAEARFELATNELSRLEALGDLASPQQLDNARTQQKIAEADAKLAAIRVSRSVISAPFEGVVGDLDVEKGEVLSPGSPVVRVIQLDPAIVTLSVADRDVVALRVGTEALVSTDAQSKPRKGEIARISPAADMRTRAFEVEVEVDNEDGALLPGMIASVSLAENLAEGAVVLPQDWVVTKLSGVGVFIEQDGVAVWRPVELGTVVRDQVLVRSGLEAGDRVVITGHRELAEGDVLLIAREGTCCKDGRAVF